MRVELVAVAAMLTMSLLAVPASAESDTLTWNVSNMTGPEGGDLSLDPPSGNDAGATCTGCAGGDPYVTSSSEAAPGIPAGYIATGTEATATVFYKSWNSGPAPETTVTVTVLADDSEVATGSATQDVMLGSVVRFDIVMDYTGGDLPAGTKITLRATAADHNTGAYNPFAYPRADGTDFWHVTLPVRPAVDDGGQPQTIVEDLASPSVAHAFSNATSDTYVLNFTNDFANATATFEWAATDGTIDLQLNGPAGTLFESNLEGAANQTEVFEGAALGDWNLTVTYTNFTGTFGFSLTEAVSDVGGDAAADVAGAEGDATENSTTNGTAGLDDASQEAPGVALPLLGLGLLAVAGVRRRR